MKIFILSKHNKGAGFARATVESWDEAKKSLSALTREATYIVWHEMEEDVDSIHDPKIWESLEAGYTVSLTTSKREIIIFADYETL